MARLLGAAVSQVREAVSVYVRLGFMALVDEATSWSTEAEAAAVAGAVSPTGTGAANRAGAGAVSDGAGLAPDEADGASTFVLHQSCAARGRYSEARAASAC